MIYAIVRTENKKTRGLDIVIENPKGSIRHGKEWAQKMAHDYGYIEGTVGADGDEVDVFVGPDPESDTLYIIDQNKASGEFDEHKVMLGFSNIAEAKDAYHANYPEGWDGFKCINEIPVERFWDWYEDIKDVLVVDEKRTKNKKENNMSDPYKFGSHNATELLDRGNRTYGSKKDNSVCECPVCFGGKRVGLLACHNCKGTGIVENEKDQDYWVTKLEVAGHKVKEEGGKYTVTTKSGAPMITGISKSELIAYAKKLLKENTKENEKMRLPIHKVGFRGYRKGSTIEYQGKKYIVTDVEQDEDGDDVFVVVEYDE